MRVILILTALAVLLLPSAAPVAGTVATNESPRPTMTTATTNDISDLLGSFPPKDVASERTEQIFELTYHFYLRDAVGATQARTVVTGDYSRLPEGRFRWNNVTIAGGSAEGPLSPATPLQVMEDFGYGLSEEIVDESLYERFPGSDLRDLVKTMVWDGMMLELVDMTLDASDALPLHEFAEVTGYEDFDVQMCDWGKLTMRDLRVKWSGVTMMHGEPCAVALYQSFSNPVDAGPVSGRSCYWGQFWISLEDREIERLTLNEDILLETPSLGGATRVLNIQREVDFEKRT